MAGEHWHPFLLDRTERQVNLLRHGTTRGGKEIILHCYGWCILDNRSMKVIYENHIEHYRIRTSDGLEVVMDLFCDEPDRTTWENYFLEIAQKRLLEAAGAVEVSKHTINPQTRCCVSCGASERSIYMAQSYPCPGVGK